MLYNRCEINIRFIGKLFSKGFRVSVILVIERLMHGMVIGGDEFFDMG